MITNKRGSILAVTIGLSIVFILLGYYAIYFSTVKRETFEKENMRTRAFWLAEAGKTGALAGLMYHFQDNGILETNGVATVRLNSYFNNGVAPQNPLGLLTDYCGFDPNTPISINVPVDTDLDPTTPPVLQSKSGFNRIFSPPAALNPGTSIIPNSYTATVTIIPTPDVSPNPSFLNGIYTFHYQYEIISKDSVFGSLIDDYNKKVTITGVPIGPMPPLSAAAYDHFRVFITPNQNFALYALFTGTPGDITWFIPGQEFKGPVHCNTFWRFLGNPSAHFYDTVTQVAEEADFYDDGHYTKLKAQKNDLSTNPKCYSPDIPLFDQGFSRGVEKITLPAMGSYNQKTMKEEALGDMIEPGLYTKGLWVAPENKTEVQGGIFISASSTQITMGKDENGNPSYEITVDANPAQGACIKTVTINYATGKTTIANNSSPESCANSGSPAREYSGIPNGKRNQGIIIYSRGGSNATLSGMVQKDTAITVAVESDLHIVNNITYEDDPLINANAKNILGVVCWVQGHEREKGIAITGDSTLPYNLRLDGIYMAPNSKMYVNCGINGNVGKKGTATIFGGLIESYYGAFGIVDNTDPTSGTITSGYLRKLTYDTRMSMGMAPPYFPTMIPLDVNQSGLENKPIWSSE